MNNSSQPLIVQVDTVNSRGSLVAVATGTARTVPEDNAEDSAEWRTGLSVRVRRRWSVDHNRVRPGHGHTVTYYFPGKVTGRGEGSATPASEEMRKWDLPESESRSLSNSYTLTARSCSVGEGCCETVVVSDLIWPPAADGLSQHCREYYYSANGLWWNS